MTTRNLDEDAAGRMLLWSIENERCAELAGSTCRVSSSSSEVTYSHLSDTLTNHPSTVIALIGNAQLLTGQFVVETEPPRRSDQIISS